MSAFMFSGSFVRKTGCARPRIRMRPVNAVRTRMVAAPVEWAGKNRTIEIDGIDLNFDYIPGESPVVMYLPQFFFSKDPLAKSNALASFCERRGQAFISPDYYGTGRSGGDFKDGTISMWTDHVIEIMERVLRNKKVVLVTSGVGVWVGMHVAMRRKKQIVGIVGMAVDPDFTEDLLIPSFSEEQKKELEENGKVEVEWGKKVYPISKLFLEDAKDNLLLRDGPSSIDVDCPVRLIQGMADEEIPIDLALRLASSLKSEDVQLTFIKGTDHSMESEADFEQMCDKTASVLDQYFEFDLRTPGSG